MVTFRMVVLPEFVCKMKEPAMPTMMSAMLTMRLISGLESFFSFHMGDLLFESDFSVIKMGTHCIWTIQCIPISLLWDCF